MVPLAFLSLSNVFILCKVSEEIGSFKAIFPFFRAVSSNDFGIAIII